MDIESSLFVGKIGKYFRPLTLYMKILLYRIRPCPPSSMILGRRPPFLGAIRHYRSRLARGAPKIRGRPKRQGAMAPHSWSLKKNSLRIYFSNQKSWARPGPQRGAEAPVLKRAMGQTRGMTSDGAQKMGPSAKNRVGAPPLN